MPATAGLYLSVLEIMPAPIVILELRLLSQVVSRLRDSVPVLDGSVTELLLPEDSEVQN